MVYISLKYEKCEGKSIFCIVVFLLLLPFIGLESSENVIGPAGHEHGR